MTGGKNSGSSSSSSPYGAILASWASQLFRESNPTLKLLFGQMNEALKTGGVGAQIPIIQSAVTNMQSSLSQSMGSAKDWMSRINGEGSSPLGGYMLNAMNMAGQQGIASTKTNMAMDLIAGAPALAGGTMGQAFSGLGGAVNATTNTNSSAKSSGFDFSNLLKMFLSFMPQASAAGSAVFQ